LKRKTDRIFLEYQNDNQMKTNLLVLITLTLFFGSCKKEDPEKEGPCGVKDPIEELAWLKKDIVLFSTPPSDLSSYAYFTAVAQRLLLDKIQKLTHFLELDLVNRKRRI
jgi:hypothetical protein